jgi:hypothetical protein
MSLAIATACSGAVDGFVPARDGADLGLASQLLGGDLVAHGRDAVVLGADEGDAFFLHAPGEVLVLAEEAVARVHGLRAGALAGGDDLVGHQIALAAGRRADADRLVGQFHMAGVAVGLGVHRHGGDAHASWRS